MKIIYIFNIDPVSLKNNIFYLFLYVGCNFGDINFVIQYHNKYKIKN